MERFEMAETLSRKAGVTLEEARQALEENEWDMLDAMIALERRGRVSEPEPVVVNSAPQSEYSIPGVPQPVKSTTQREPVLTNGFAELWGYIKKFVLLLVKTDFTVVRKEKEFLSFPVFVLVLLLIVCFWVTMPLLLIGLFFGCKYRFVGTNRKASDAANKAMEKLETAVDSAVDSVKDAIGNEKNDND